MILRPARRRADPGAGGGAARRVVRGHRTGRALPPVPGRQPRPGPASSRAPGPPRSPRSGRRSPRLPSGRRSSRLPSGSRGVGVRLGGAGVRLGGGPAGGTTGHNTGRTTTSRFPGAVSNGDTNRRIATNHPTARAWSPSGTTVTTCTPNPARRTRTPARCCSRAQLPERGPAGRRLRPHRRGAAAGRVGLGPRDRRRPRDVACVRARRRAAGDDIATGARPGRQPRPAAQRGSSQAARDALAAGAPVLVQVPRRGYVPVAGLRGLPRARALCRHCNGPLGRASGTRCDGVPLVWPARGRRTLPGCGGGGCAPRGRRGAHGGGTRPRLPGRAGPRLRRRGGARPVPPSPPWSSPRPGRNRLPRAATARRCCWTAGPCCPRRPAGRRGDPAPLVRRGRAGPAGRRRPGRRGGRRGAAAVQALVRWDPAGLRRPGAGGAPRAGLPARGPDGYITGARRRRRTARPAQLPTACRGLGPVPLVGGRGADALRAKGAGRRPCQGAEDAAGVRSLRESPRPRADPAGPPELL